ncbi:hypothetical protein [Salinimonas chungwhensis]|uniref:hypothetical protein n=1 Tax=Salinimonas chungwhensis TaxID=265425 RepID=UPI0003A535AB|nr:hypothetical protein [Salinimonas chungwhensis]
MKQVLLHIGTGKTGSSSIQKTLSRNRDLLNKMNISYPRYGHPTNHEELNIPIKGDKGPRAIRERFKRDSENFEEYRQRLLREFIQHIGNNSNSIISAEHLYTLKPERIAFLKQQFSACGVDRVKVILYLREPVSLYKSQLQQKLKASSQTITPGTWKYRFVSVVERWMNSFKDVEVREFNREQLHNQDVVDDFLHIASQFFDHAQLLNIKRTKAANESYSLEEMYLLQQFRKTLFSDHEDVFMPASGALMRNFSVLASRDSLTQATLKDDVAENIRYKTTEEVKKLRELLGEHFFTNFETVTEKPNGNFEHVSSVSALFKNAKDIEHKTLKLAIRILEKNLLQSPKDSL